MNIVNAYCIYRYLIICSINLFTAVCHGFGCWFDVNFIGSTVNIELSTGPDHPGTHWYQVCTKKLFDELIICLIGYFMFYH